MAENFQDNVVYGGSTLAVSGDAIAIGSTDAGAKSLIFNTSNTAGHLAWLPTANRTINLPDASGTVLLSSQGILSLGAAGATATSGSVIFSNSNNVSFGMNGGTITATITVPAQTNQTIGLYGVGNTTQNSSTTLDARSLSFNGLGEITVGFSNGTVQISGPLQSAQTQSLIQAIYDGANSITTGTIRFTNANGVSFSINGQTISGSVAAQTVQTEGLYAIGNTTGQSSSSTFDARTLSISGAGNISVGYSGNALVISAAAGGQSIQTQSIIQGVYDGANSISTGTLRFTNANGVSFSINGQTVSASIAPRAVSQLMWPDHPWQTNFSISNASFSLQHFNPKADIVASQANLLMALSGNSGSSGALTVSLGLYTMQGSTMSLLTSNSRQISWTSGAATNNSTQYGGLSGTRYRTVSLNNWSVTAGDYVIGAWFQTTNDGTWRAFGYQGPTIVGAQDGNETNHYFHGFSTSSFVSAMPGSINRTDTNYVRTGANALQQIGMVFAGTV